MDGQQRARALFRRLYAFLTLWGVLVGIGLAPTVAALVAFVYAQATGNLAGGLAIALTGSVVANLILVWVAVRSIRYSRDLEHDMKLVPEMLAERLAQHPDPWLPDAEGTLVLDNGLLESLYSKSLALARSVTARDAELGIGWISLTDAMIDFNGFSQLAERRLRIWAWPGQPPQVITNERRSTMMYPIRPLEWRHDASWHDLIIQSWAIEHPIDGSVTLCPREPDSTNPGRWRIEYRKSHDGVISQPTEYVLREGRAVRVKKPI